MFAWVVFAGICFTPEQPHDITPLWTMHDEIPRPKIQSKVDAEAEAPVRWPHRMKFDSNNKRLAVCYGLTDVREGLTGKKLASLNCGPSCAWSSDGKFLAGENAIWRTSDWSKVELEKLDWSPRDIAFDAQKQRWYYGMEKSALFEIRGPFPDVITTFSNDEIQRALKAPKPLPTRSHPLSWAKLFDSFKHEIEVVEIVPEQRILVLGRDRANPFVFSNDGKQLPTPNFYSAEFRDIDTGKILGTFEPKDDHLMALAVDGAESVYCICRKEIHRWKKENWMKVSVRDFPTNSEFHDGACFDSGKSLALLASTGEIIIVDPRSGTMRAKLSYKLPLLRTIAAQRDGKLIFAANEFGDTVGWRLP